MKLERFTVQACCGKVAIIFKTGQPLTKDILAPLIDSGFKEQEHFTQAGILYVENAALIISGPLGSNRLQVTCKHSVDCEQKINDLEGLLLRLR